MKRVCIIHTGGTIGMVPTDKGYHTKRGFMKKALEGIEELNCDGMPKFDLIEYENLLDSSNISVRDWIKIAEDIKRYYDDYDGFVILHGTDTMAYTASALSFMLDNLSKPVILTGSQIPISEIRNDGRDNLITALILAANYNIPEVCLYFHGKLFRGNRAVKISADDLEAFGSPNYPPLAEVGIDICLNENAILNKPDEPLKLTKFQKHQIAVIKIFPGIQSSVLEHVMTSNLEGIVLEAFGSGNMPEIGGLLESILNKSRENDIIIVVCTQCYKGTARIGQYKASHIFSKIGAVSGYDMTVEAAVAKLYYLLSKGYSKDEVRKLMGVNLRGELTN